MLQITYLWVSKREREREGEREIGREREREREREWTREREKERDSERERKRERERWAEKSMKSTGMLIWASLLRRSNKIVLPSRKSEPFSSQRKSLSLVWFRVDKLQPRSAESGALVEVVGCWDYPEHVQINQSECYYFSFPHHAQGGNNQVSRNVDMGTAWKLVQHDRWKAWL